MGQRRPVLALARQRLPGHQQQQAVIASEPFRRKCVAGLGQRRERRIEFALGDQGRGQPQPGARHAEAILVPKRQGQRVFEGLAGFRQLIGFLVQIAQLGQIQKLLPPVARCPGAGQVALEIGFRLCEVAHATVGRGDLHQQRVHLAMDTGSAECRPGALEVQQGACLLAHVRQQAAAQHQGLAQQLLFGGMFQQRHHAVRFRDGLAGAMQRLHETGAAEQRAPLRG